MAQVSMTVRLDSQLKQNFDALCSRMGLSANAAMNIFANAVVRTRSIPFKIDLNEPQAENPALKRFQEFRASVAADDSRPDMTLDEINEEIRLAREEKAAREKTGV
ncbi:type II toxin-antitoxin system RelB/DinJ family antitoxin [Prevotella communis]|uniref:RelB antitoxin n=1 Tax=Prevotella communis TaxID=2913614 RepID=A0A1H0EJJ6_9BACT|nr:type II toxin-antitoxin system RelB/DinJ family antitoxin [Prevotella communis]UKK57850.1 type II toxin-antitoxin system RelB/DinJ family antitoxin [Prevotella communis]SDN82598.1 RelB antitoxin [Prevotella communis]